MNYEEALAYVQKAIDTGKKQGHQRLLSFLEGFDSPQEALKIIHVAGTNGKGSVCAMLSSVLERAGYKVGLFTSPHLLTYNERFRINGKNITDERFTYMIKTLERSSRIFFNNDDEVFSFFELMTLMAFLYFSEEKVDFLILETGIGGRLDSTNIIRKPVLSVITAIGMDHMEYLGNNLETIAMEKSGIIKKNSPTVLYFQTDEVYNVIKNQALFKESKLYYLKSCCTVCEHWGNLDGTSFTARFDLEENSAVYSIRIKLLGGYQVNNACLAILTLEALMEQGFTINTSAITNGLLEVCWPGRLEIVGCKPLVILDGAHNENGAAALKDELYHYFKDKDMIMVLGVLADKEHDTIVEYLCRQARAVVVTQPNNKRAYPADKLYELVSMSKQTIYLEQDYRQALKRAVSLTDENGVVVCAGSLYLIADIRKYIKKGDKIVGF